MKPIEEMSFWVRHVVKTRGSKHLRSPVLELAFYQRFYLDLAVIVLFFVLVLYKLQRTIGSFVYLTLFKGKEKNN